MPRRLWVISSIASRSGASSATTGMASPRVHQVGDAEERAPAERPGRMERGVVLGAQAAQLEQRHGEGVAHRERRGRARGRRQVHRARLLGHAHVEDDVALAGERRVGIAGEQHDRHAEPLERRQDRQHLVGLARVRQRDHDVAARHHAEVAVHAFGRMEEVGRRAGRGERGGDLAPDEARLAHAGDDDPPGAARSSCTARSNRSSSLGISAEDRLRLDAQDPLGQTHGRRAHALAHARPVAARIASSCSSSAGRSSIRSMLGRRTAGGRRAACGPDPRASP